MRGGFSSEEHRGKFIAGGAKARRRQRLRSASISSGRMIEGGIYENFDSRRLGNIDVSPAVWRSVSADIGDCEFVDEELDDVLLRALHERVVYASSACCHHAAPLQDITIGVIAAVDRTARKGGVPLRKLPRRSKPLEREGEGLLSVVAAMFPESREGKYLTEVVHDMFEGG